MALDGKPLVASQKFLIKMVNDVENVDEKLARDPRFANKPDGQWKLDVLGEGPVKFGGVKSAEPIQNRHRKSSLSRCLYGRRRL